jgi:hypothetical protein
MLQTVGNNPFPIQPVRQGAPQAFVPPSTGTFHPAAPKPLAKDSLDIKDLGIGVLAGSSVYLPMVVGNYTLSNKAGQSLLDSLKAPLMEKSTLAMMGGAALAGGIVGAAAGRNTDSTGEALTTGAMVGMTIGALGGVAVALSTQAMTPAQGAMRGAMLGGFTGGAGGTGAYLLREGK